jgi:hypothetical protein
MRDGDEHRNGRLGAADLEGRAPVRAGDAPAASGERIARAKWRKFHADTLPRFNP